MHGITNWQKMQTDTSDMNVQLKAQDSRKEKKLISGTHYDTTMFDWLIFEFIEN